MKHAMVDLETLGKSPKSVVLSVGIVIFEVTQKTLNIQAASETGGSAMEAHYYDEFRTGVERLYLHPDPEWQLRNGRKVDFDTLQWWMKQSPVAQYEVFGKHLEHIRPGRAMELVQDFITKHNPQKIWAMPSEFDNTMLDNLAADFQVFGMWDSRKNACFRTIRHMSEKPRRFGTHHIAVEDAMFQAWHLLKVQNEHPNVNVNYVKPIKED